MSLKEMFYHLVSSVGISIPSMLGGSLGGFINAKRRAKSFWSFVFYTFVGGVTSGYLSPIVIDWLAIDEKYLGAVGFVVGIISMQLIELLHYALDNKAKIFQLVLEFIKFKSKNK